MKTKSKSVWLIMQMSLGLLIVILKYEPASCEFRVNKLRVASGTICKLQVWELGTCEVQARQFTSYELSISMRAASHVRLFTHWLHNIPSLKRDKVKVMFNNNSSHASESNRNLLWFIVKNENELGEVYKSLWN